MYIAGEKEETAERLRWVHVGPLSSAISGKWTSAMTMNRGSHTGDGKVSGKGVQPSQPTYISHPKPPGASANHLQMCGDEELLTGTSEFNDIPFRHFHIDYR
jgi:hypothetical protein